MGNKKQNKLGEELKNWIKSISISRTFQESSSHNQIALSLIKGFYVLNWTNESFSPLLESISKQITTVTPDLIMKKTQALVFELLETKISKDKLKNENGENLYDVSDNIDFDQKAGQLIAELNSQIQTYAILIPIEGLDLSLEAGEITIGNFTIYRATHGSINNDMKSYFDRVENELVKKYFNAIGCYIEIKNVIGEDDYAVERAVSKAQELIHVLNFLLGSCYARSKGFHKITLAGQPTYSRGQVIIFSSEQQKGSNHRLLANRKHKIDHETLALWDEYGVNKVGDWFNDTNPNIMPFSERMKRSIAWYSIAVNSDSQEVQFVSMTTALESLLLDKGELKNKNANWGSITQKLADRVAYLLGRNFSEREEFEQLTKDLYDLRSNIVHNAYMLHKSKLLFELEGIVRAVIITLLKYNFASWDLFLAWEKKQKYSLPSDPQD